MKSPMPKAGNTGRIAALSLLILVAAAALGADLLAGRPYAEQYREAINAPPSREFPLGTDELGRDRFSRLLHGTRVSLLLAPAASLVAVLMAALVGALAALAGGWWDRLLAMATDVALSVPWLFALVAARAALPLDISPWASVTVTFGLLGLLGWPVPARAVRAALQRLAGSDFVLAARSRGASRWTVFRIHLLPNLRPVLGAQFWTAIPLFILAEANLGMLGLGVVEPLPSWGGLLRELETQAWDAGGIWSRWWILAPAGVLAMVVAVLQAEFAERERA